MTNYIGIFWYAVLMHRGITKKVAYIFLLLFSKRPSKIYIYEHSLELSETIASTTVHFNDNYAALNLYWQSITLFNKFRLQTVEILIIKHKNCFQD